MTQNNKITYVVRGETVMVYGPECFDDFEAKADDRDEAHKFAFKLNYLQEIIEQKNDEIEALKKADEERKQTIIRVKNSNALWWCG